MDKATLLKRRHSTGSGMPEAAVPIPELGGEVRVRGLSRAEVLDARSSGRLADFERSVLAMGMLDPALSEQEAGEWLTVASAGEIRPVVDQIVALSGLADGAAKEAYKSAGDDT